MKLLRFQIAMFLLILIAHNSASAKVDEWTRYTSDHFEIYSDANKKKITKIINKFESFHFVVSRVLGINEAQLSNNRLKIFLFNRESDLRQFGAGKNTGGFYTNTLAGPRILMKWGISDRTEEILYHEYVHHIMRNLTHFDYPLWYHEGFAEVLSTADIKDKTATVGDISYSKVYVMRNFREFKLSELLTTKKLRDEKSDTRIAFYAKAWLFVHYLQVSPWRGENKQLKPQSANYLQRLASGEDPIEAFEKSFEMSIDEMEERLNRYEKQSRVVVVRFDLPNKKRKIETQELSKNQTIFELADLARLLNYSNYSVELLNQIALEEADAGAGLSLLALMKSNAVEDNNGIDNGQKERDLALSKYPNDPAVLHNVAKWDFDKYLKWDAINTKENTKEDTKKNEKDRAENNSQSEDELVEIENKVNRVKSLDKNNLENYRLHWTIALLQNDGVKAAKSMMEAYQIFPTDIRLNYEIGSFLADQKSYTLALDFLERAYAWSHTNSQRKWVKDLLDRVRKAEAIGSED